MANTSPLTLAVLKKAITDGAAALRLTLKLDAVSPKVFPPTYEGGKYATEARRIGGSQVPCVILDSVPSQANRMELALQEAVDGGEIELPVVSVDFSSVDNPSVPRVTSLQAPHRLSDAILRDSMLDGKSFRESDIGKALNTVSPAYATPLLQYAPHCLVFGLWDSTGPRGGLGVKFARALVSEVIGVNAVLGTKTSSRIDPLNIRATSGKLYKATDGWTLDEKAAVKGDKGKAVPLGKDGKPSEANHGNVTPSLSEGGYTLDYAEQTTVLSLPALRRLRFPVAAGEKSTPVGDAAARTYLAALGLLSVTLAIENGYDLRSRCLLHAAEPVTWELLGRPGEPATRFTLTKVEAIKLYTDALADVQDAKLSVQLKEVELSPMPKLLTLVTESMKQAAADVGGEGA